MTAAAIDRYLRAVRATGASDQGPVATREEVDQVVAAMAPLIVPGDLVETWLRIGFSDWLLDNGELQSPRSALQSVGILDQTAPHPRHLFPVSFASHTYLFIELGTPGGPPGGSLLLSPIAEPLVRHAPSLAWAFGFVSVKLEAGAIGWDGSWWTGLDALDRDMQWAAVQASWPAHLQGTIDSASALTWPAHWQGHMGIDPARATPLGANATVQDLLTMAPGQSCRLQVRISALANSAAGSQAEVADESGEAVVWISSAADPFFVVRIRDHVELEVEVAEPQPPTGAEPVVAMFDARSHRFRATLARPLS